MGSGSSRPDSDGVSSSSSGDNLANNNAGAWTAKDTSSMLDDDTSTTSSNNKANNNVNKKSKQPPPPENESGYARAQRICRKKKRTYDACYTAQLTSKDEDCNDLFEEYRNCFLTIMANDMAKRGVKVSDTSMIGECKDEIDEWKMKKK
jgi:hypothetical protein